MRDLESAIQIANPAEIRAVINIALEMAHESVKSPGLSMEDSVVASELVKRMVKFLGGREPIDLERFDENGKLPEVVKMKNLVNGRSGEMWKHPRESYEVTGEKWVSEVVSTADGRTSWAEHETLQQAIEWCEKLGFTRI